MTAFGNRTSLAACRRTHRGRKSPTTRLGRLSARRGTDAFQRQHRRGETEVVRTRDRSISSSMLRDRETRALKSRKDVTLDFYDHLTTVLTVADPFVSDALAPAPGGSARRTRHDLRHAGPADRISRSGAAVDSRSPGDAHAAVEGRKVSGAIPRQPGRILTRRRDQLDPRLHAVCPLGNRVHYLAPVWLHSATVSVESGPLALPTVGLSRPRRLPPRRRSTPARSRFHRRRSPCRPAAGEPMSRTSKRSSTPSVTCARWQTRAGPPSWTTATLARSSRSGSRRARASRR